MRLPYVQLKTTQGCLRENSLSILVFSAAGQSSSREVEEARRHERWRVKGSEARRGVQGRKRDHGNIFNNRAILSNTLYTLQEPPCSAATRRLMHACARRNDKMRAVHATIRLAEDVTGTGMAPIPDLVLRYCNRLSFRTSCTFASFAALRLSHDHHVIACAPAPEGHWQKPQRSSARRSGHHLAHWNSPGRQA